MDFLEKWDDIKKYFKGKKKKAVNEEDLDAILEDPDAILEDEYPNSPSAKRSTCFFPGIKRNWEQVKKVLMMRTSNKAANGLAYLENDEDSGVILGQDQYGSILSSNGPENVLVMGPTRCGKGVNTVIPTALTWKGSAFFLDYKGEAWRLSSGYRKVELNQKVIRFEPYCTDDSANRWNPLAEIRIRKMEEYSDVSLITSSMMDVEKIGKYYYDPFWDLASSSLMNGVILHLLYKNYKENIPPPSIGDVIHYLSFPYGNTDEFFDDMMTYQHITPEEFLYGVNPLLDIYGEHYAGNLDKINDILTAMVNVYLKRKRYEEQEKLVQAYPELFTTKEKPISPVIKRNFFERLQVLQGNNITEDGKVYTYTFKSMAKTITEIRDNIRWAIDVVGVKADNVLTDSVPNKICWAVRDDEDMPFHRLLTHPRVAEQAASMRNGAEQTRGSILMSAMASLKVYEDPVVQRNMSESDFCLRDLYDQEKKISCYFVVNVKDTLAVKPIAKLFVNMLLNTFARESEYKPMHWLQKNDTHNKVLFMLDEFIQLGYMPSIELGLATCASYGVKMCLVCQNIDQIYNVYTKDNFITTNCNIHTYFRPDLTNEEITTKFIDKTLGKQSVRRSSEVTDSASSCEAANIGSDEVVVAVAGNRPVRLEKIKCYMESIFTSKILEPAKCRQPVL